MPSPNKSRSCRPVLGIQPQQVACWACQQGGLAAQYQPRFRGGGQSLRVSHSASTPEARRPVPTTTAAAYPQPSDVDGAASPAGLNRNQSDQRQDASPACRSQFAHCFNPAPVWLAGQRASIAASGRRRWIFGLFAAIAVADKASPAKLDRRDGGIGRGQSRPDGRAARPHPHEAARGTAGGHGRARFSMRDPGADEWER